MTYSKLNSIWNKVLFVQKKIHLKIVNLSSQICQFSLKISIENLIHVDVAHIFHFLRNISVPIQFCPVWKCLRNCLTRKPSTNYENIHSIIETNSVVIEQSPVFTDESENKRKSLISNSIAPAKPFRIYFCIRQITIGHHYSSWQTYTYLGISKVSFGHRAATS